MIRRWNCFILWSQVGVGGTIFLISTLLEREDAAGLGFFTACIVALLFGVYAFMRVDVLVAGVALSSASAILGIFSFASNKPYALVFLVLLCVLSAGAAVTRVRPEDLGPGKTSSELFLDALPIVGVVRYAIDALRREADAT